MDDRKDKVVVRWYNAELCYGFGIQIHTGKSVFLHSRELCGLQIRAGDLLLCTLREGPRGGVI